MTFYTFCSNKKYPEIYILPEEKSVNRDSFKSLLTSREAALYQVATSCGLSSKADLIQKILNAHMRRFLLYFYFCDKKLFLATKVQCAGQKTDD